MDEKDRLIELALTQMPLAPTPPGFTARVMAEVWRPVVRFRLEFLDLALPAFFALLAALGFGVALLALAQVDPLLVLKCKASLQVLLYQLSYLPQSWLVAGVAGLVMLAAFALALAGVVLLALAARSIKTPHPRCEN